MEPEQVAEIGIVDEDLVSFFDLLARFDYEDQKKSGSVPVSDPSAPSEGSLTSTED